MIRRGAVFRNMKVLATKADNAFDFYKGENISAGLIEGAPVARGLDIDEVSDSSLWRFRDILPNKGFAFLQISLGLTAAPFDPRKIALLDTATLFFPQKTLENFPFDLALSSRVYQYFYALALRQGAVSKLWSHLYPRNLRQLPWSDALLAHGAAIEALRPEYERLCKAVHNRRAALLDALGRRGTTTWGTLARTLQSRIRPSAALEAREAVWIDQPRLLAVDEAVWRIQLNGDLLAYVDVTHPSLGQALQAVLPLWQGESRTFDQLLSLDVPDATALQTLPVWEAIVHDYDAGGSHLALDALFDRLDQWVGGALGLTGAQIKTVQAAMQTDAFLRHIRPSLPFAGRAQRGLSVSLAASNRYDGESAVE
jgi:hypothetical protein